jgi:hypothetical protein
MGRSVVGVVAQAAAVVGLVVIVVSLPLPYAENEAGGSDHHHDAHTWYVWHPFDNLGMPLLLIGVVSVVRTWRAEAWRGWTPLAVGTAFGWLGVWILYGASPNIAEEMLYGGPEVELLGTRWVVGVGWILLWTGAMATNLRAAVKR